MESAEGAGALGGLDGSDPLAVAAAVRRCGERLRDGVWDPAALADLLQKITVLAKDASPRVRQSVAEVSPHLPEHAYRAVVALLAKDRSGYVREAAERAVERRAALSRAAAQDDEHDARVERWYAEIDRAGARAVARRIAAHETEYFVRRMVHEGEATRLAFDGAARQLREALEEPVIDRARARALVARLEERFALVQHVLATGRANARSVEPQMARVDVAALLADEASLLRARYPDRADRLRVDLSGVERPLVLDADAAFLRQAFGNVLRNAVEAYDATPGAPIRVTVTGRADALDATIAIRDLGAGMGPEDVARAFVPFGSSKPGGTGFGLFIARRVARAVHGGDLALESAVGEGTVVTMRLPLRQERPSKRARARGARS